MNKDFDVEDILKRFHSEPDPRTKDAVLSRFRRLKNNRDFDGRTAGFWKRPIPLYWVAASLVVVAGLFMHIGQRTSGADIRPEVTEESIQKQDIVTSDDIKWSVAQNDFLLYR